ncbi:hypothetical protein B6U98_00605 [Thermoplasmatales archaeon ex4572_165]|nr:MAG: hypothetical protein B6U98_00605 [Thermoplasmatales archaeon ex4572_165]
MANIEMKKSLKTIGVYTKNFRLYHKLVSSLKNKHFAYVSLNSLQHIPNQIGVILTSHNEIHDIKRKKVIAADVYDSIEEAIDKAFHMLIGKDLYHHIHFGIDPGEKPGIAIVGDDILLNTKQASSPEQVLKIIKRFLIDYPAHEYLIRIGHGSILLRNRIINSLIPLNIPIEIVNESKTSSHQTQRIGRDVKAAASIALLHGGKVQRKFPLKPTRGEIRRIQEESRKISNGAFSISEHTAILVLKGEISLLQAVEDENKNN